ncbi:uncharacterized protein LOC113339346 [Papaver somniferum]|uniref:uncharacterized protein LOC113339346 n=1 Tax=Papaver somniferum TaxID=3469 RepID=UPI000E6FEABD|nr:uncharacterized protein LOC113339346 [Papaver somniferum]
MVVDDQIPPSSASPSNPPPNKDSGLSPSSHYYVHSADNPTTVIFTSLLTSDNYCIWERGIRKSFSAKAKLGYIDVSVKKPTNSDDIPHWIRADDLVGIWVANSVDPVIRNSVMSFPSAREQWLEIKNRFFHTNALKLYALKQSISTLKQDNLNVAMYFTNLKTLWDQMDSFRPPVACICAAGKSFLEHHNQDRSMEFLQGLHDRFSSLRSQCMLMEPMPSAAKLYNLVRQDEEQQGINSSSLTQVDSATLNVSRSDPQRSQQRSLSNPGNGNNNNKRPRPFCDHCTKHGHTRQTCWKMNGYPSNPPKLRDQASYPYAVAVAPTSTAVEPIQAAPTISVAQYARLMSLLEPDTTGNNIT